MIRIHIKKSAFGKMKTPENSPEFFSIVGDNKKVQVKSSN